MRAAAVFNGHDFQVRVPRALFLFGLGAVVAAGVAGFLVARATEGGSGTTPLRWHAIPAAPIAGRTFEASVWTGKELIVAGGMRAGKPLDDGAAYDPAAGTWRHIATPPAGVGAGAVWTGETMVTWNGNGVDGTAVGAVYDPSTDAWRRLPAGPLGPREGNALVWTGKEVLVIGGHRGDGAASPVAAAVNPATGTWRVLHGLDRLPFYGGPNGAVWDGDEAVVAGNLSLCPGRGSACDRTRAVVLAYDPAADRAGELPQLGASALYGSDTAASLKPIAWTGTQVIFTTYTPGVFRLVRYTPVTRYWELGDRAPCVFQHETDTQTAWAGDRFVAACSRDAIQVYHPPTRVWQQQTFANGPAPLDSRTGSAIAWTGKELLVWSGSESTPHGPTPADGASITLPR